VFSAKPKRPLLLGIHSIFWTALIADLMLLVTDSILTGLFTNQSVWRPSWILASACMGKVVMHWPAVFDFAAILGAMIALFPFCYCYALILATVILPWSQNLAITAGTVFGALCYFPSLYGLLHWRPWLIEARGWEFFIAHVVFGLMATAVLLHRSRNYCD